MKNQEYLIEVGDTVLYRANAPIAEGYGYVHDKDYTATVTRHHPEGGTSVEFIGDDGKLKKSNIYYNDFNGGMSECKLILEPEELKRRQEALIQKWVSEADKKHEKKIAGIRSTFDE